MTDDTDRIDFILTSDIDLRGHQLRDARAENVETLPDGGSPARILYVTASGLLCYWDETQAAWVTLAGLPMGGLAEGDAPVWDGTRWSVKSFFSAVRWVGSVDTYEDLPTEGVTVGDMYNVRESFRDCPAGTNVVWNGEVWDPVGGPVDFGGVAMVVQGADKEQGDILMWDESEGAWRPTSPVESGFALAPDLQAHIADFSNPHQVTAAQVGLGNVDNTSDTDKPVSDATQAALDLKVDRTDFDAHLTDYSNPHRVTKEQVGLDQVDNTSDLDKPVSNATQAALDLKQDIITGGAASITDRDLTPSRALISSEQGKVGTSNVTSVEVGYLDGVIAPIQEQLDAKVGAVDGKGLSTNDFTDACRDKLDGIAEGAQVNIIEEVRVNGTALEVADRAVDVPVPTDNADLANGAGYVTGDYVQEAVAPKAERADLDAHVADFSNPHQVTAAQVGLGNVDNTSDADKPISNATQAALDLKADLTDLEAHLSDYDNPHMVTKEQIGLGNVDNTSDADKPISDAVQEALDRLREIIELLPSMSWRLVDELPTEDIDDSVMYLVPASDGSGDDLCNEYIYLNGAWELVGTHRFRLEIVQDEDGITVNGEALQDASATRDGLMTRDRVQALDDLGTRMGAAETDIDALEETVASLAGSADLEALGDRVSDVEGDVSDLEDRMASAESGLGDVRADLASRPSVQRLTVTGDGSSTDLTATHTLGAVPAVALYKGGEACGTDMTVTETKITLHFNTAPALGTEYTLVVMG